ncbi:hypothetical protein, partial [Enterococcus faecium]|uniref:hypothetical protein n=1 Tax=Enterococcus faecium TaxID=1352 RepID=UPI0009AF9A04
MDKKRITLLEMDYKNARNFLLKSESYLNAQLPEYISFDETLKSAKKVLTSPFGFCCKVLNLLS